MACQLARVAHVNDATTLAPTCCGNATQLLRERNRVPGNAGPRQAQQQEPSRCKGCNGMGSRRYRNRYSRIPRPDWVLGPL